MLIVVSNPVPVAGEASIINALFDEGLEMLHLRKPGYNETELQVLLKGIKPRYMNKVALHQHHKIAREWGIARLHFTETARKYMSQQRCAELGSTGNIFSTSVHDTEAYKILPAFFNYTFFGPVFDSISKTGYKSAVTANFVFPLVAGQARPVAIGGITASNIQKIREMKFQGAAVLGMIWQESSKSVEQFKKLQTAWNQ